MFLNIKTIVTDIRLLLILVLYIVCNIMGYSSTSRYIIVSLVLLIGIFELPIMIQKKFKWHYSMSLLLLFSFWGLLSYLWAYDNHLVVSRFFSLLVIDVFYIFAWNIFYEKENSFDLITTIIILSGFILSLYVVFYYGVSNYYYMLLKGYRVGMEITNVNYIGLNCIMSLICCFYRFIKENKLYYFVFMLVPLIVSLGTGSRKVIIAFVISVFALVLFKKSETFGSFLGKIFKIIIMAMLVFSLLKLPAFSNINNRFSSFMNLFNANAEVDESTLIRKNLINQGLDLWRDHFIVGIGLNGTLSNTTGLGTYSHNNYVELLATVGLIGFVLFYLMYIIAAIKSFLNHNYSIDKVLVLLLICINLLLEFACVSYYSFQNYVFFLLMYNYVYTKCEVDNNVF